jgi:hypothetical protein
MAKRISFMNIYRNGFFHREGKPGNIDIHGGDAYDTKELALQFVDPPSHYLTTIPFEWDDAEGLVTNPPDSVPTPLSVSRKRFAMSQEQANYNL